MAQSLAPAPPRGDLPETLEQLASYRVKAAALSRPAVSAPTHANMVLVTNSDGGVVVFPPSDKLVILSDRRR